MSGLTVRQHAEAIRDRHCKQDSYCGRCTQNEVVMWPCDDHDDAVAILRALDEAKILDVGEGLIRLVPEPVVHHDTEESNA